MNHMHHMNHKPTLTTLAATILCLLTSALCPQANASTPTTGIITLVPSTREGSIHSPTAIALMQPADYVCAIVEITSRKKILSKDLAAQTDDIRQTTKLITQAVEKTRNLSLHTGPVRFSATDAFSARGAVSISTVASGITSFVSGATPASQTLRILCKLTPDQTDTLDSTLALNNLINTIQPPAQTDLRIATIMLAVDTPERQREQLLNLIRDSAAAMRKIFAATRLTIEGLENPVQVRQVNDTQVELYIDYKLSVETGQPHPL